ncbi:MAG: hypothetical protein ACRDUS_14620 [Mycobacterium sp.]
MIDITDALAGIVADFESTLDELRDDADVAPEELLPDWPPPGAKPADHLQIPTQILATESGLEEDDIYRWQRWTR